MHALAACLESFVYSRGGPCETGDYKLTDGEVCNVAESIAGLMAGELELLITEVNDDHVLIKPEPATTAANRKAVGR